MFQFSGKAAVLATLTAGVSLFGAVTPSIGVAISDGALRINEARTAGNASVFSGSTLQTERPAQVRLLNGGNLQFGVSSRGQLFSDHVDLQQGSARISGVSANANGLSIRPDANSSANVELHGAVVQVAALTGSVHVFNSKGMAVANLLPGRALNLTPQDAGASAPSSMTGCATRTGDVVTLSDETSNVVVQLRGATVRPGRRVQIMGTTVTNATPAGGATQVLNVTSVKEVGGSCRAVAGAAAGAGGAAAGAAGAAAGASGAAAGAAGAAAGAAAAGVSATTAVVAGVAAAAVAGTAGAVAATQGGNSGAGSGGGVVPGCVGVSPCTP